MRRACLVSMLLISLLVPAQGYAQDAGGNPFGPLPQSPPPTPEPPKPKAPSDNTSDDGFSGSSFWFIMGTTIVIFAGVAVFITRDMRRSAGTKRRKNRRLRGTGRPATAAADPLAGTDHRTGSQRAKAKAQQRAKTKAARKQRRKTRSR